MFENVGAEQLNNASQAAGGIVKHTVSSDQASIYKYGIANLNVTQDALKIQGRAQERQLSSQSLSNKANIRQNIGSSRFQYSAGLQSTLQTGEHQIQREQLVSSLNNSFIQNVTQFNAGQASRDTKVSSKIDPFAILQTATSLMG